AVKGGDHEAAHGRPAEAAAADQGDDQGDRQARPVPGAQAQPRQVRLCHQDERRPEPEARDRARQPRVPRRRTQVTDPRVARLAELAVSYSLGLKPGQVLRVDAPPVAAPLAVELYRAALAVGAHPYIDLELERLPELLLAEGSDEQLNYVSPIAK